jgi:S1-C subfamily serine protease
MKLLRPIVLVLLCILSLILAGCGDGDPKTATTTVNQNITVGEVKPNTNAVTVQLPSAPISNEPLVRESAPPAPTSNEPLATTKTEQEINKFLSRTNSPAIGISIATADQIKDTFKNKNFLLPEFGLCILGIEQNSPAQKAKLKELDFITSVNSKPVKKQEDLASQLTIGKESELTVYRVVYPRNGKPKWQKANIKIRPVPLHDIYLNALSKEMDEFTEVSTYRHPHSPKRPSSKSEIFAYITVEESVPTLNLQIQYVANDWLFMHKFLIKTDNGTFELAVHKRHSDNSAGSIWEWCRTIVGNKEKEVLEAVIKSNKVTLRHEGTTYYKDRELTQDEIQRLRTVMLSYEIMKSRATANGKTPATFTQNSTDPESRPPDSFGSGFYVTSNGYLLTNQHVVNGARKVFIYSGSKKLPARVVKTDAANDLALLKVSGTFAALPVSSSRGVKLGQTASTVGFPNPDLQGKSPKLTKGEISSLSGASDDPKYFQISVPLQPGNSGGPLVDAYGNVIGVVTAKLSAGAALAKTGNLPENVNYAVKGTFVMGFLESVPEVAEEMLDPKPRRSREFTEVVSEAEKASVMILVYE